MANDAHVPELRFASTVDEAVGELARLGADGAPIAGGTWVMLAPLRRMPTHRSYVALTRVEELRQLVEGDPTSLGGAVTMTELRGLSGPLAALGYAAAHSAPPAIANVATLAGNLRAAPYPGADLVAPLLALDASLELASPDGRSTLPLADYLASRDARPAAELIVRAVVPAPAGRRSAYERLTVRESGEEPVASVAVSVDLAADGSVAGARVAFGSVEDVARRSAAAEAALVGGPLTAERAEAAGKAAQGELSGREGLDAPGWYRVAVLPALVRRAVARLDVTLEA